MTRGASRQDRLRAAFHAHHQSVMRYCLRRLPVAEANEAAADVFAVAWKKIDRMPGQDELLPWLYAIAGNVVRNSSRSLRRSARLQTKAQSVKQRQNPGPEDAVVERAVDPNLELALHDLAPSDREIVMLRAYEDLSIGQLAMALGCSYEAAKKKSSRALNRLRAAAAKAGVRPGPTRAEQEGGEE